MRRKLFDRALYYPTIDIHNTAWLKSAALFWDRIETIVPDSENHPYRRRITQVLQNNNILYAHKVNPFCEEIRGIEDDVVKFIDTPEGKKSFVKPMLRFASSGTNRRSIHDVDSDIHRQLVNEQFDAKIRDTYRDFFIHVEKLPLILREKLGVDKNENGYVWASKGFMSFYMTLLANRICQNHNLSLLTDRVNQNVFTNKILVEGLSSPELRKDEKKMKRAMMYQIIMDDIKISPSTPIERIIEYRKRREPELVTFRKEMDRLMAFDIDEMSPKEIENRIKDIYVRQVKPAEDAVKVTLKDAKINWSTGVLSSVFTGLIPASIAMGADLNTNIIVGTSECIGIAITLVPHVLKWINANNSPYSYLVEMGQITSPDFMSGY